VKWHRNEPLASKRSVLIAVYADDGSLAPATTLFNGTNELLVEKADGDFVAPGGSLLNTTRPLVFADQTFTVNAGTDVVTLSGTGPETGSGAFTTSNSGGALPGGLAAATDYWWIKTGASTGKLATSLANALAGVAIDITSAGTGVHTLSDKADTKQLNDGLWRYVASQAELNYRGDHFGIRISKAGFQDAVMNVDLVDEQQLHAGTAAGGAAGSITLDGAASATNDLYKDCVCLIVGGTGAGQVNTISSYAGGTQIATMARNWAVNPDATSQFVIVPAPSGANPTSVAAAVWAAIGEGAYSFGDLVRLLVGAIAGRKSNYTTGAIAALSLNGAKTRVTWTTDETGVLTVTIGDLT
jgi:hypothetical protein